MVGAIHVERGEKKKVGLISYFCRGFAVALGRAGFEIREGARESALSTAQKLGKLDAAELGMQSLWGVFVLP